MSITTPDIFLAISDPNRRAILNLLTEDSMTINTLAANFDMSRPAVSKHIKILHETGFISISDIGRERYCTLNQRGFHELQGFIDHFDKFWSSKLRKLEGLLNNKNGRPGTDAHKKNIDRQN